MLSRRKRAAEADKHRLKVIAHHERVLAQRPLVDTTAPRSMAFQHMKVNKKKEQMQRENQLNVWKRNQAINESLVDIETREGGDYTALGAVSTKSLRIKVRLDEVDRINRENARLYESLVQWRGIGNAGSHAKFGASPAEGWKHHEESFEEFRRRLLELPQLKKATSPPTLRRPATSHPSGGGRGDGGGRGGRAANRQWVAGGESRRMKWVHG
jgi:hypothetical protein